MFKSKRFTDRGERDGALPVMQVCEAKVTVLKVQCKNLKRKEWWGIFNLLQNTLKLFSNNILFAGVYVFGTELLQCC